MPYALNLAKGHFKWRPIFEQALDFQLVQGDWGVDGYGNLEKWS